MQTDPQYVEGVGIQLCQLINGHLVIPTEAYSVIKFDHRDDWIGPVLELMICAFLIVGQTVLMGLLLLLSEAKVVSFFLSVISAQDCHLDRLI